MTFQLKLMTYKILHGIYKLLIKCLDQTYFLRRILFSNHWLEALIRATVKVANQLMYQNSSVRVFIVYVACSSSNMKLENYAKWNWFDFIMRFQICFYFILIIQNVKNKVKNGKFTISHFLFICIFMYWIDANFWIKKKTVSSNYSLFHYFVGKRQRCLVVLPI